MSEKLQYDLRSDTDVQESTEMAGLSSKNKESVNSNNELRAKVDGYEESLSEKEEIIQQLTSQVGKSSHTLFVYYQMSLSVKDETISQLATQVDKLNESAEEYQKSLSEKEEVISERDEAIQQLTEQADRQKETAEEYRRNLSEKEEIIHELTSRIDKLNESAEEYQKSLSEKEEVISERDEIINQLTSRIYNLNVFTEEYQKSLSEKEETVNQVTTKFNSHNVINLEQFTDEKKETIPHGIPETDSSDVMVQVKSLYNKGEYDEAYRIADDLRQKKPDFGFAYFVLGTIEVRKGHYDKGEELLNRAVQLGLPDDDMAWAFHNLGISSLRKKDYEKAREFLEKTVKLKSNMVESRKILKLFNNLLDEMQEKEVNDEEEGEAVYGKIKLVLN